MYSGVTSLQRGAAPEVAELLQIRHWFGARSSQGGVETFCGRPRAAREARQATIMPARRNGFAGVALVLALGKGTEAFTTFPGSPGRSTGSSVVNTTPWYGGFGVECV